MQTKKALKILPEPCKYVTQLNDVFQFVAVGSQAH